MKHIFIILTFVLLLFSYLFGQPVGEDSIVNTKKMQLMETLILHHRSVVDSLKKEISMLSQPCVLVEKYIGNLSKLQKETSNLVEELKPKSSFKFLGFTLYCHYGWLIFMFIVVLVSLTLMVDRFIYQDPISKYISSRHERMMEIRRFDAEEKQKEHDRKMAITRENLRTGSI